MECLETSSINIALHFTFLRECGLFFSALHITSGLSNAADVLELLLSFDADVDALNDDACTPLFYATQSNNLYAASLLLNHGANVKSRNLQGKTCGEASMSQAVLENLNILTAQKCRNNLNASWF